MTTLYDKLPTLSQLIMSDLRNAQKAPSRWAESWGREMGIFGITTRGPSGGTWPAGQDDDLDAFRHTFMNAILTAWNPLTHFGEPGHIISRFLTDIAGSINETSIIGGQSAAPCSKAMDIHNNRIGQHLAPTSDEMMHWLIITGENPNRKIAERVANAVKSNATINFYGDPRMSDECRKKSKKKGHFYRWRTQGDNDVRWEHALREGKIYMWTEPLSPGQDFGCRCWAEPVDQE